MLVHLQQYKHEEVQFDDNRTTGRSQTEDTVDKDSQEYFGKRVDAMDVETWETVEYEGDPIQRRDLTLTGVTSVSAPDRPLEGNSPLPGTTVQVRVDGGIESIEQAVIVEVQDADVQERG